MEPREFHIWDFPNDIRIKLPRDIHTKFFEDCIKVFGSVRNYERHLKVNFGTAREWKNKYLFIPLWAIKNTIKYIEWNWNFIEKNILSYKGINTSSPVVNPILPIKESPELLELITHMLSDGCISKGTPFYTNSSTALIENFGNLLRKCFGDINEKIYMLKTGDYYCTTSKVVYELINHFYHIKFGSLRGCLPNEIFTLPEDFSYNVIKALVDDEGFIRENRITVSMKNKKIINQLRILLAKYFNVSYLTAVRPKDDCWYVAINSSGLKDFHEKIELVHPTKIDDLTFAIEKSKLRSVVQKNPRGKTKLILLDALKDGDRTVKELSHRIFINSSNINNHLKELKSLGLVKEDGYLNTKGKPKIWTLNNKCLNMKNMEVKFNGTYL